MYTLPSLAGTVGVSVLRLLSTSWVLCFLVFTVNRVLKFQFREIVPDWVKWRLLSWRRCRRPCWLINFSRHLLYFFLQEYGCRDGSLALTKAQFFRLYHRLCHRKFSLVTSLAGSWLIITFYSALFFLLKKGEGKSNNLINFLPVCRLVSVSSVSSFPSGFNCTLELWPQNHEISVKSVVDWWDGCHFWSSSLKEKNLASRKWWQMGLIYGQLLCEGNFIEWVRLIGQFRLRNISSVEKLRPAAITVHLCFVFHGGQAWDFFELLNETFLRNWSWSNIMFAN